MRVSLNQIKQYIDFTLPPVEGLVAQINQQLGGVEDVTDVGKRYDGAVIAKVVSCNKHPNADKLSVCLIDAGGETPIEVVCGAPNVREGLYVVWLQQGATVPATFDDKEPFVLSARELRGVVSNGMLASPKELGLGDSHEGILEIDPNEWKPNNVEIKPGTSFAEAYGLDDTIIDIENKMFTHRPDLFGQLGVAREIAGIQQNAFVSPDWYKVLPQFNGGDGLELAVSNDASSGVPRFMAVAIKNVVVKPSPVWLQAELVRLGGKPINNIVDVTNYVMLLTAQPTHAYDYDKLRGHKLGARMANKGEKVTLLNHKTYELDESDIVIVDGDGPVGLAGIMGGGDSEVSSDTKNIVLEVANFDMYTVRRSSMRHGLFTDALTRFNKGQSPLQNPYVLDLLTKSIIDVAGGEQASEVFDVQNDVPGIDGMYIKTPLTISAEFINARLGLKLTAAEIRTLLENVEFSVNTDDSAESLTIHIPFWRTDIVLPEDIVEEVGRLYGFDKLPRELPQRSIKPAALNDQFALKNEIREMLSKSGANEVLTYSFVHERLIVNTTQDPKYAFVLSNALSPDLQYYRLSVTPSLLDKVHMNIKAGHENFALFELGKSHFNGEMDPDDPNVPNEDGHLALIMAYSDKTAPAGAAFYYAKRYVEKLTRSSDYTLVALKSFDLSSDAWGSQLAAAYEPERSAVFVKDEQVWGIVGEFKQSVRKAFKLPAFTAGFELHMDMLSSSANSYVPLSKFPSVTQDVSIRVKADTAYKDIRGIVEEAIAAYSDLSIVATPTVIYQPESGIEKTTTFRFVVTSYERTLTDNDVRPVVDTIAKLVNDRLRGEIV